jgi:type II secretory pathway pseudopilin PulG
MKRFKIGFHLAKRAPRVRGDSILEVVIATAILSTMMIATFDILQRALDTNINVKNRIIALNIAREGVEAVRNIRDTNWLKYSGERREKWLCMDEKLANPTDDPTCKGVINNTDIINNNVPNTFVYYTVDFDTDDDRFYLNREALQAQIDFEASQVGRDDYRLYQETVGFSDFYTHRSAGNVESPFYRQIQLRIFNPYESGSIAAADRPPECRNSANDSDESCIKGRLNVVSRVFWQEEGRTRVIALETNLFDFFERDAY